jgi:hypothetical protein
MLRVLIAGLCLLTLAACGESAPESAGGPATVRRLTDAQYRNAIADVFGSQIVVAGRFDPLQRTDGLLAVGASNAAITPSAFERYHIMARSIAAQVVNERNRTVLIGCAPADPRAFDESCAKSFYGRVGRLLFRRPLGTEELASYADLAKAATEVRGDFHEGLAYGLQGLLTAPDFLYVAENTVQEKDKLQLDAFARATRLSFLLWNTTPDDVLLAAAESGELLTDKGLERQVERMMASPRFKSGVRAFFNDMLALDQVEQFQKDTVIYPAFTLAAATDSREQVLRTLVDLLVTNNGDYRDIFTTRTTFVSRALGLVYQIPASVPGGWAKYEFPEGDPRAGIHTQISFVALHSHPNRSSPTLRGKAIRELLMCQKVPDPPGDVNFDQFNDPNSPNRTARERLVVHSTDPACAGCHKVTDPIGLALETFDGAGQSRTMENGVPIDTSGEINGVAFQDAIGLGRALREDPAVPACLVSRIYAYGVGRAVTQAERPVITYLEKTFADEGYRLPELIRHIALSDAFYAVSAKARPAPASKSAGVTGQEAKS